MKKITLLTLPLVAISLLASCKKEPLVICTVTFNSNGGTDVAEQKLYQNQKAYEPTKPTRASTVDYTFQFKEWQLDGEKYDFNTPVMKDITLEAKWKENKRKYVVAFDTNGSEGVVPIQNVTYGECANDPGAITRRDDSTYKYSFNKWHEVVDGQMRPNEFDFTTKIDHDILLKADWIKENRFYNVSAVNTNNLKFVDAENHPINGTQIPSGSPFTFYMKVENPVGPQDQYVVPSLLQITVGGRPRLTSGYTIKIDKDNPKFATVTIDADKIVGDLKIVGEEVRAGSYAYEVPYAFGLSEIKPGTHELSDDPLVIKFKKDSRLDYNLPGAENIYVQFDNFGGDEPIQWVSPAEKISDTCSYDIVNDVGELTIRPTYIKHNISVIARASDYDLLEYLDWKNDDESVPDIEGISFSGLAPYIFNLGETKTVKVNDIDHQVRIIGFNHDVDSDNRPIGLTFEFVNTIYIDSSSNSLVWENKSGDLSTNKNFPHSNLNCYLNYDDHSVLSYLDDNLKSAIKTTYKKVGLQLQEEYITDYPYPAKLFPLSNREIGGNNEAVAEGEGTIYEFYDSYHKADQDPQPQWYKTDAYDRRVEGYWLRSPCIEYNNAAWRVYNYHTDKTGGLGSSPVHFAAYSVAPAFCI